MSELVDFLTARLDEDEAVARAATPGPWDAVEGASESWWVELPNLGDVALDLHGENARHIARHDPARVLREVTAKRHILGLHEDVDYGTFEGIGAVTMCRECRDQRGPCPTLRALAAPFCDHPDFQEQWR